MKLNYSTLAFSIAAVLLGGGRSFAQEGYAPMGSPYPAGAPAPYDPTGMPPAGMPPGYAPQAMMGAPGPMGPMAAPGPMMGGPAPYAYMAAANANGQPAPGMEYGGPIDGSMYEPAGNYVQYENVAGGACNDCGDGCALPPRAYGSFDSLLVWRHGGNYPAILTTSDPADEGVLGAPTTSVLFGDGYESGDAGIGGRITIGLWLDDYQNWSAGGRILALEEEGATYSTTSDAFSTLAFPFYNTNTGMQDSVVVALPGSGTNAADNTTVNLNNENSLYMGDIFVTKHIHTNHGNRWDFVTGYSYAKLEDSFSISAQYTNQDTGGSVAVGDVVAYTDSFAAINEFHGGQLGLIAEFQDGPFSWRAMGKISLGGMKQEATISGLTTVNGAFSSNNGIYARSTNSGSYSRDQFAYIPEANVDMIYAYNCNLDFKLGATFVYFSDVATGATLINPNIDPSVLNPTDPQFNFIEQDFWVLGMTFGMEYHY
ncbi:BBP7 family outer membrane beta-barrel protein [Bremerella sp. P1]|uniref:BBP7 family outer membrane beta-barrel protein n=1 Tax=Bremerella sp. P1 TaxID=3026424 RepID=UPI0023682CB0|nr:BBP7 family outer membrane beta-barrel protein [Bremerella sp. P1]WDI42563.1 BBP7 family outer membrane beta-barrel protein [Bremerella sp. P1]